MRQLIRILCLICFAFVSVTGAAVTTNNQAHAASEKADTQSVAEWLEAKKKKR